MVYKPTYNWGGPILYMNDAPLDPCTSLFHIAQLVGGLEHEFYDFPYIGNVIIPTDFDIFQRDIFQQHPLIYF